MPAPGNPQRSDRAVALIDDLLAASTETANVEFKDNNSAPALLQPFLWETGIAASFLTEDDVLARIDYPSYFDLTDQPLPHNRRGIVERLSHDRIIVPDVGGRWNITHLGAILFAKRLDHFDSSIARKAVRFTAYDGPSRADTVIHRYDEPRGYGAGFVSLVDYVDRLIPKREQIGKAFRTEHPRFPPVAIRELIANALIHQDMTITGAGPSVELFSNRLEITNPGTPLISPTRFIDAPPRSRNEALAAFMRRMKLCEEQGTGIDKVVAAVEREQMPPPDFRVGNGRIEATRAILFAPVRFADMMIQERVRACYQHAALKFLERGVLTNASLRQRFGLAGRDSAKVSQVIRLARERALIKPADPDHPRSGYVPFWA